MNIDALSASAVTPKSSQPAEQVEKVKKNAQEAPDKLESSTSSANSAQPEELLSQIKSLTEGGIYSVRFENNAEQQLIVKVVDSKTDEVIRQIPPEELMELTKQLNELRGNLVDTVG